MRNMFFEELEWSLTAVIDNLRVSEFESIHILQIYCIF